MSSPIHAFVACIGLFLDLLSEILCQLLEKIIHRSGQRLTAIHYSKYEIKFDKTIRYECKGICHGIVMHRVHI